MSHGRLIQTAALVALLMGSISTTLGSMTLGNDRIRLTLSENGALESVENRIAGESYPFGFDAFRVESDLGVFSNQGTKPVSVSQRAGEVEFRFEFAGGALGASLVYSLGSESAFFRRHIQLKSRGALRLTSIKLGETRFARPATGVLHYVTFIAAPTVEFIRYERGGLFTGIENPFYRSEMSRDGVSLGFEPGLILKPGEGYRSEPQFVGVYKHAGVWVEDSGRPFRYDSNGSGYKPIDRNEMRAMRAFALDYLAPVQDRFLNINYHFFHPLPLMPKTGEARGYFTKCIDAFSEIGGDMIIFRPLHPYTKPDVKKEFWDVLPGDPSQVARQVADYASAKGITCGFYMGCAAHGAEGNAAGLPFRPDKPDWKKSDASGRRAPDNCLACDEYFEWWLRVQSNTIQRFKLTNWSWDPSLGSGMNCHDESHGHIADRGAYKGWRRCIELMARLKEENPGLFIQGFYGTKNFGLWGLKHVDQHEVYNEQTIIVSTRHHQISDERQNADGLRFQNNWSMRFRFTPAVTGHSLVHRVSEGSFDPELAKAWDYYGWKYSVMSSLAVAGSVMPTLLPYETRMVPDYVEFYRKWLAWAKANFDLVNCTEPFGEQVQPGAVDGYSRINGDRGFLFLFNGNPRPSEITFEVGDEINLQVQGSYQFREIYPSEQGRLVLDNDGKSIFSPGESARITVPANSCALLELQRVGKQELPVLVGASGTVAQRGEKLEIEGLFGKPGESLPVRIRVAEPGSIKSVRANGVEQPFAVHGDEIVTDLQFAGDAFVRELDHWSDPDGKHFEFPGHGSHDRLKLSSEFVLRTEVRELLEAAKPANFAEMGARIARWQTPEAKKQRSYSYHNFIGARPERLWLILPFLVPPGLELSLNGRALPVSWDQPSSCGYVDVTEHANYGSVNRLELSIKGLKPNAFMGPYLLYPEEAATTKVVRQAIRPRGGVTYRQPLVPALGKRYAPGEAPEVTAAWMMGKVTLRRPAELRLTLNVPAERIKRVMFFESGFTWMGQHPLKYDKQGGYWSAMVMPGERARIQENEEIYVWAEDREGRRGEYKGVKVGWDYER